MGFRHSSRVLRTVSLWVPEGPGRQGVVVGWLQGCGAGFAPSHHEPSNVYRVKLNAGLDISNPDLMLVLPVQRHA